MYIKYLSIYIYIYISIHLYVCHIYIYIYIYSHNIISYTHILRQTACEETETGRTGKDARGKGSSNCYTQRLSAAGKDLKRILPNIRKAESSQTPQLGSSSRPPPLPPDSENLVACVCIYTYIYIYTHN